MVANEKEVKEVGRESEREIRPSFVLSRMYSLHCTAINCEHMCVVRFLCYCFLFLVACAPLRNELEGNASDKTTTSKKKNAIVPAQK